MAEIFPHRIDYPEKRIDYYLLVVWEDVEPEIQGPFTSEERRDNTAKTLRASSDEHGVFPLDIVDGIPVINSYQAGFFEDQPSIDARTPTF